MRTAFYGRILVHVILVVTFRTMTYFDPVNQKKNTVEVLILGSSVVDVNRIDVVASN